jgi:hypothetical protein
MSGVYYFTCNADGGRQVEHSNGDPTAPCPICRIAQLEAHAKARAASFEVIQAENAELREKAGHWPQWCEELQEIARMENDMRGRDEAAFRAEKAELQAIVDVQRDYIVDSQQDNMKLRKALLNEFGLTTDDLASLIEGEE